MAPIASALRRALFLLLLAAAVGAAVSSWRSRSATPTPAAPPQWPEWPQQPKVQVPERPQATEPPHAAEQAQATERPVSSDATPSEPTWLRAPVDGTTPQTHPIKVKVSSGIYHVPGGRFYDRTRADRCYSTADAAEADGYRRSKT